MATHPQEVLRLLARMHQAFRGGDHANLQSTTSSLLQHLHVLRPSEVSTVLNHLAHAKVLDASVWQRVSDALPDLFVDPTCKSLGLAANAYARAMLKHDVALEAIAASALKLSAQDSIEGRNIAMLVNAFSKLRIRNVALMDALASRLSVRATDLNEIDLANVANGFGRLTLPNAALLDALKSPIKQTMGRFSTQNLAMIADAYARMRRRDEELMDMVASQLHRQCSDGTPISAQLLPSIIHAFAARLDLCPRHFVSAVEFSLPRVAQDVETRDLLLAVPPLASIPGLHAPPAFCRPVFARCLDALPTLTCRAALDLLEAAARLRHACGDFWPAAAGICGEAAARGAWDRCLGRLALLAVGLPPGGAGPWPLAAAERRRLFRQLAGAARRAAARSALDERCAAELAAASAALGEAAARDFDFLPRGAAARGPGEAHG